MPLATDKQEGKMKGRSDFLDKFQDGDKLIVKSNLYHVDSHYLQGQKVSVICKGDECFFCGEGVDFRKEYLYIVERLRGEDKEAGVARVPASVFFDMNKNEKLLKKSKREFQWIIGKEGEGKKTRYSTVRGEDVKVVDKEVKENNEKLEKAGDSYSKYLKDQYGERAKLSEGSTGAGGNERAGGGSSGGEQHDEEVPF